MDQYGGRITISANDADQKITGTINGVPLLSTEVSKTAGTTDVSKGQLEINRNLVEGDKITLKVTNKIGDATVEVGTASYTVEKAVPSVATTISNLEAKYSGTAANGHTVGDVATEVLASDEVTLHVDVKDQFSNPIASSDTGYVRWVVEEGSSLITKANNDAIAEAVDAEKTFTFKAKNAGHVVISAYLANGKKVTYTVVIGAKKLESIDAVTFTSPLNKEEATSGALAITDGAVLKAADVKFAVTSTPTGATAADLQLVAVDGTGENAGKVYVKATTQKAGTYKFKAYVGENLEKATVVAAESTITTTINQTVAKIEVAEVATKELQEDKELVKAVKFFNKHDEQIQVQAKDLTIVGTSGLAINKYAADAQGNKTGTALAADSTTDVAYLGFTADSCR